MGPDGGATVYKNTNPERGMSSPVPAGTRKSKQRQKKKLQKKKLLKLKLQKKKKLQKKIDFIISKPTNSSVLFSPVPQKCGCHLLRDVNELPSSERHRKTNLL